LSFTLLPAFGYDGTISFSCNAPATITCSFSPSSVQSNGSSTSSLIAVTINSQAGGVALNNGQRPGLGSRRLPLSLAVLPGLALLGFGGLRRKFLRGYRSLLLFALCLAGLGLSGCNSLPATTATPAGAQTVTIVAAGTGGSFASVTQKLTVTLTVQ
jgi:hypothetical protein